MNKHRSQKDWDVHFMREAKLWSAMSKCFSRKIGTVLVKDNRVIGTGYNGPPKDVPHCDYRDDTGNYITNMLSPIEQCPRQRMGFESGEGLEHCPAVHAEINPILQASRMGISTVGSTLYCDCGTPCLNCAKEIIQAGVVRIVCLGKSGSSFVAKDNDHPEKKGYNFPLSEQLFKLANVKLDVIKENEL
jgi:dCMP deaminase